MRNVGGGNAGVGCVRRNALAGFIRNRTLVRSVAFLVLMGATANEGKTIATYAMQADPHCP